MQIYDKEYKIVQYADTIDFVFDASTAEHIFEISCVCQNVSDYEKCSPHIRIWNTWETDITVSDGILRYCGARHLSLMSPPSVGHCSVSLCYARNCLPQSVSISHTRSYK